MSRHSLKRRIEAYKKLNGRCYYCGEKLDFENFHIEHIQPLSQDGKNNDENLCGSCWHCNLTKGPLNLEEYRLKIYKLPENNTLVQLYFKYYKIKRKPIKFFFERQNGKV